MRQQEFAVWFLRQLRSRDWTQADFARKTGIATGTVSNWKRGIRIPDPGSCDVIADVLGVDRDLVLAVAGHRPEVDPISDDDPRREMHALVDLIDWAPEPRVADITIGLLRDIRRRQRSEAE